MNKLEKYLTICCVAFSSLTIAGDILGYFGMNNYPFGKYISAPAFALLFYLIANKGIKK